MNPLKAKLHVGGPFLKWAVWCVSQTVEHSRIIFFPSPLSALEKSFFSCPDLWKRVHAFPSFRWSIDPSFHSLKLRTTFVVFPLAPLVFFRSFHIKNFERFYGWIWAFPCFSLLLERRTNLEMDLTSRARQRQICPLL